MTSMPTSPLSEPQPAVSAPQAPSPSSPESPRESGPSVMTALICEACGNADLIRVKGCWYCEKCRYKFDCYGW